MKDDTLTIVFSLLIGFWGFMFVSSLLRKLFADKNILRQRLESIEQKNKINRIQNNYDDFNRSGEFQFQIFEEYLEGKKLAELVKKELLMAGLRYKIDSFLIFCTICTIPAVIIATFVNSKFFFVGFLAFFIPFIALRIKIAQRNKLFEQQFPDTLDLLASSLRAGHSLYGSFELIVDEMPSPVCDVFKTTVDEISFGADIKDAILSLSKTMPNNMDLKFFITAVIIQREVGGNLVKILTTLSDTIRERFKILGQLKAQTAQSKLSGLMLSAIPPIICVLIFIISPEYTRPLLETQNGHIVIMIAGILTILSAIMIKRILTIEV